MFVYEKRKLLNDKFRMIDSHAGDNFGVNWLLREGNPVLRELKSLSVEKLEALALSMGEELNKPVTYTESKETKEFGLAWDKIVESSEQASPPSPYYDWLMEKDEGKMNPLLYQLSEAGIVEKQCFFEAIGFSHRIIISLNGFVK